MDMDYNFLDLAKTAVVFDNSDLFSCVFTPKIYNPSCRVLYEKPKSVDCNCPYLELKKKDSKSLRRKIFSDRWIFFCF